MRIDARKVIIAAGVIVVVVVAAALLVNRTPALAQSFTVGYVDMPRALDSHPRKASSERALQEFFQAKQREFQERSKGMTAFQRQELDRQLQQQILDKRNELLGGLDKEIRAAVEASAKDAGITVVLDRSVVLYGGTDLTEAVIARIKGNR
ncbi:MAG: OmpH family outer membrane protein [Armatimonadota bacterium]|nr:OmpH family outer membrane protein [Armatimonadota bacterium]MDR7422362.1 OmpH family outer membrane protein [Armatimonadota bacterium]MDR7456983.1 OmpH family outer membrane protein [Armatimonadota bacterium]MDR7498074.1 OmpH family outer membrane protein [Armatimonadota bacterium]MDR7512982.1 OmpH family outer membrane protein [Armatimonadota bacterium]